MEKKGKISSLLYMFLFAFVLSLTMGSIPVKANAGLTAECKKYNNIGGYHVELAASPAASFPGSYIGFYRYNVATKEVKCIEYRTYFINTDDSTAAFGETYVYYIVDNVNKVNNAAFPTLSKFSTGDIGTLSDSEKQALENLNGCYKSNSVSIPAPDVGIARSLSVNTGVKKANLVWYCTYDDSSTFITGYIVKRYNAAGTVDARYYTKATTLTCPLPYNGTYSFTVTPYYVFKGKTYYGAETGKVACSSAKIYSPACLATKLSNKVAKVTVNVPEGANGTILYQYTGGKWKQVAKVRYSKKCTVKKNTAGKKKYRVVSYVTDAGKTYYAAPSKAAKPQSNVCTCNYPKYAGGYKSASHFWRPIKISYSGNKVLVKGRFINTHIYAMKYFNIKLTVKAEGKVIGTKTIKCGKIKAKGTKVVTVKLDKSKKNMDLRNGKLYWSYKVIRADAL